MGDLEQKCNNFEVTIVEVTLTHLLPMPSFFYPLETSELHFNEDLIKNKSLTESKIPKLKSKHDEKQTNQTLSLPPMKLKKKLRNYVNFLCKQANYFIV